MALRPPILYGKLQAGSKCCYKMQQPESRCAMTAQRCPPKVPYKMQNPEVRSSRNRNFGNNMEALQNAKPGAFFFMKKWCWYKMHGPGGLRRTIFGPNLLCSKPGLAYFVGKFKPRWKPTISPFVDDLFDGNHAFSTSNCQRLPDRVPHPSISQLDHGWANAPVNSIE